MTQSDIRAEGEVREGSPAAAAPPEVNAQARAHARAMIAEPSSIALQAVTESTHAVWRTAAKVITLLDRPVSLIDAHPLSFRQARAHHHRCADAIGPVYIAVPRLVWGYFHLLVIKPALNFLEWVTESPARLAVAVAVAFAVWYWS